MFKSTVFKQEPTNLAYFPVQTYGQPTKVKLFLTKWRINTECIIKVELYTRQQDFMHQEK